MFSTDPQVTADASSSAELPTAAPWYHTQHPRTSICQSITESFWDIFWRRHPLLQKDDGQNDRIPHNPHFCDSQGHQLLSVDTVCVTKYSFAAEAGLLQGKGWVRSWMWPLCPPWCIPQHLNILGRACWWSRGSSTVLGVAKRPGPESDI